MFQFPVSLSLSGRFEFCFCLSFNRMENTSAKKYGRFYSFAFCLPAVRCPVLSITRPSGGTVDFYWLAVLYVVGRSGRLREEFGKGEEGSNCVREGRGGLG